MAGQDGENGHGGGSSLLPALFSWLAPISSDFRPGDGRLIKRALVARASPILDFVLFMLLTIGLSLAGHTFQNVYETRTLVESVRPARAPACPALARSGLPVADAVRRECAGATRGERCA